ncbi:hypothetical protein PsorP6_012606 [Peronosclerospora sorghi]|uniref:Uncharacterized protein n=1 Tax=Peronosclerospora sorghi TaxID=230839 RepID=A0ACC0WHL9_9STRA|nr:hypothetical protein PsorP6_012606 [Peronosclerospora sorghi]
MDNSTNSIQQDFQLNVPVTWEAAPCVLKEGWEGETQEPTQTEIETPEQTQPRGETSVSQKKANAPD